MSDDDQTQKIQWEKAGRAAVHNACFGDTVDEDMAHQVILE